jgi:glycosyltransferase involved in cell wall biosynthesis
MAPNILFVSSNYTYGGSEVLWSETAALLAEEKMMVQFAVKYEAAIIQRLLNAGAQYINLTPPYIYPSIQRRLLRKLRLKKPPQEVFLQTILKNKPLLVILSQGNNVDGKYYMTICRQQNIAYVTVTQLVTDILWPFINDEQINELRLGYKQARMNYFVSQDNVDLHTIMMGEEPVNSKIVPNPFSVPFEASPPYPPVKDYFNLAIVGRLETFHKGHDLLLQVLKQSKWKNRPLRFNFYGSGPHQQLLERLLKKYEISNVFLKGYAANIEEIWQSNHFLVLPSRMEGQALALNEAMLCCRGAVVTNVGGAKDLIEEGKTGFVAKHVTVEHIDEALEKAWSMKDQWQEIGKNAGRKIREIYKENPIVSFAKEIKSLLPI